MGQVKVTFNPGSCSEPSDVVKVNIFDSLCLHLYSGKTASLSPMTFSEHPGQYGPQIMASTFKGT